MVEYYIGIHLEFERKDTGILKYYKFNSKIGCSHGCKSGVLHTNQEN